MLAPGVAVEDPGSVSIVRRNNWPAVLGIAGAMTLRIGLESRLPWDCVGNEG